MPAVVDPVVAPLGAPLIDPVIAAASAAVDAEIALLRSYGHALELFLSRSGSAGDGPSGHAPALPPVWSRQEAQALGAAIDRFRPDVVHVHDHAAGFSPAVLWAAADRGIPVVLTLHDYALVCPQGRLLRDGRVCQECLGTLPLPAVRHRCRDGSRSRSLASATALIAHRALGTWRQKVSRYIALSDFCRARFVEAGLPAARIRVKPNFTVAPLAAPGGTGAASVPCDFAYAGPLTRDSGVIVLAQALLIDGGLSCCAAGAGPEQAQLAAVAGLRLGPATDPAALARLLHGAVALVLPTLWQEPFPQRAIEAFAHGVPVIASRLGTLGEIVREGKTGLLFEPGDAQDLARKMRWARDNPAQMQAMGRAARLTHERRYSAQENYRQLLAVYNDALTTAPL
jgi:glycosyltransferase involved in cell wall biosynthesis